MQKRSSITQRHNMVLLTYTRLCREIGHHTELEPFAYDERDERGRPDATCVSISPHVAPTMVDVSVTHPACDSLVVKGQRILACATEREVMKTDKYKNIAANENMEFVPLVLESTGAFGRKLSRNLKQLSMQAEDERVMSQREFLHYSRASIAFALHRGNGRVMQCFASAARVKAIESSVA